MDIGTAGGPASWVGGRQAAPAEEKTAAILMSSGVFLGLLGSVFTLMSWQERGSSPGLDLNKLMGPFMLSVGAVFMVISMVSFRMLPCWLREHEEDEEGEEGAVTAADVSMAFHCASVAFPKPPPYDSLQHPAGGPALGVRRAGGPCFYPGYPGDNAAFTADGGGGFPLVSGALTSPPGIGMLGGQQAEERHDGSSSSTCPPPPPPPPAYEEICRRA